MKNSLELLRENAMKRVEAVEVEYEDQMNITRQTAIRVSDIILNPDNTAAEDDTEESIDELAESIYFTGLIHPLAVNKIGKNKYMLLSGERRFRAVQKLGWSMVQCTVYDGLTDDMAMVITIEANMKTREYSASKRLALYMQMVQSLLNLKDSGTFKGAISEEISKRLRIDKSQVSKYKTIVEGMTADEIKNVTNIDKAVREVRKKKKLIESTEMLKATEKLTESTEMPETPEKLIESTGVPETPEKLTESTEMPETPEKLIESTGVPETPEKLIESTGVPKTPEKLIESTEMPEVPEKLIESTGMPETPEKLIESTEMPEAPEKLIESTGSDDLVQLTIDGEPEASAPTERPVRQLRTHRITAQEVSIEYGGISYLCAFGIHVNGGWIAILNFGVSAELSASRYDVKHNARMIREALHTSENIWLPSAEEIIVAARHIAEIVTEMIGGM